MFAALNYFIVTLSCSINVCYFKWLKDRCLFLRRSHEGEPKRYRQTDICAPNKTEIRGGRMGSGLGANISNVYEGPREVEGKKHMDALRRMASIQHSLLTVT